MKTFGIIFGVIAIFVIFFGVNMWAFHNEIHDKPVKSNHINKFNYKYKRFNF